MSFWPRQSGPVLDLGTTGSPLLPDSLKRVVLGKDHIRKHFHFLGNSGYGKSRAIANIVLQLISQGIACAVVDPHFDVLSIIMKKLHDTGFYQRADAFDKLWYVDFARQDRYVPFNILQQPRFSAEDIAQQVVEVCERVWPSLG